MSVPVLSNRRVFANGARRPECVQCLPDGRVLCSDSRGGISAFTEDGNQRYVGIEERSELISNGFAIKADGTAVFANVGTAGGIWSVDPKGNFEPVVESVEGTPNFVLVGPRGEIWFSVLTAAGHSAPLSESRADGYIARLKDGNVEIMTDGLITANEFKFDAQGRYLYINETFARRTTRFDVSETGQLSNRSLLACYDEGTFPDGLALDANGDIWTPSIISNQILHVTKEGAVSVLYKEYDAARADEIQSALSAGTLTRELIYQDTDAVLNNPSSLAFGGRDLRTLYAGSITNTYLCAFDCSVAGQPMAHWTP